MKSVIQIYLLLANVFLIAQNPTTEINTVLDNWHHAASIADEDTFFGSMTANAHYLGTDAKEDWTRDEMKDWAKPYFEKDVAWDFKKIDRHLYYHTDGKLAWFDETLNTWMGVCRGSGVVILTDEGWKIEHYVLSVTIPNEKLDSYLELD